jgi:hypothetical protein
MLTWGRGTPTVSLLLLLLLPDARGSLSEAFGADLLPTDTKQRKKSVEESHCAASLVHVQWTGSLSEAVVIEPVSVCISNVCNFEQRLQVMRAGTLGKHVASVEAGAVAVRDVLSRTTQRLTKLIYMHNYISAHAAAGTDDASWFGHHGHQQCLTSFAAT